MYMVNIGCIGLCIRVVGSLMEKQMDSEKESGIKWWLRD